MAVKDGRTLAVSVFDPTVAPAVEKAIRGAGLNLNPVSDGGNLIRVPVPRIDKKAREGLCRTARDEAEKAKIAARHVRREAMNDVKKVKDNISKAEVKRLEKDVQEVVDRFVGTIEKMAQSKVDAIQKA